MMQKKINLQSSLRNYQVDVLKLILAFLVFFSHTGSFIGENTRLSIGWVEDFGFWSVHWFFIISGFLMVNSYFKKQDPFDKSGISAFKFVSGKFKNIALPFGVAWVIYYSFKYVYVYKLPLSVNNLAKLIPTMFLLQQGGVAGLDDGVIWYLSAMLICMLPLYYMLCKNSDFFIYVFAPLAALLLYGYTYNSGHSLMNIYYDFYKGGLLRALFGILFGVVAWIFYDKIQQLEKSRKNTIILTIVKLFVYLVIAVVIFNPKYDRTARWSVNLLTPAAIALSFSSRSYIAKLFSNKIFKFCGGWSLDVYLLHMPAKYIVEIFFPDSSYKFSFAMMLIFTVLLCFVHYAIIKFLRLAAARIKPLMQTN